MVAERFRRSRCGRWGTRCAALVRDSPLMSGTRPQLCRGPPIGDSIRGPIQLPGDEDEAFRAVVRGASSWAAQTPPLVEAIEGLVRSAGRGRDAGRLGGHVRKHAALRLLRSCNLDRRVDFERPDGSSFATARTPIRLWE